MHLSTAQSLIRPGINPTPNQHWYDLGAGSGLFTTALASLLPSGKIVAVDKDRKAITVIPDQIGAIRIEKLATDFARLLLTHADGILMANSLHFIKEKRTFLAALKDGLKPKGILLVVEYEMTKGNSWVPYPVDYKGLEILAAEAGFANVKKLATAPSRYQSDGMYSAMIS
jgi:trans-aconitate methyltransferase